MGFKPPGHHHPLVSKVIVYGTLWRGEACIGECSYRNSKLVRVLARDDDHARTAGRAEPVGKVSAAISRSGEFTPFAGHVDIPCGVIGDVSEGRSAAALAGAAMANDPRAFSGNRGCQCAALAGSIHAMEPISRRPDRKGPPVHTNRRAFLKPARRKGLSPSSSALRQGCRPAMRRSRPSRTVQRLPSLRRSGAP